MKHSVFAYKILIRQIRDIEQCFKGVHKADEEALHQFRIGTRRLKNSLSLFKKLLPRTIYAEWMIEMRHLICATSEARDLDVYVKFLNTYAGTLLSPMEKDVLLAVAEDSAHKRARKQKQLVKNLNDLEQKRLLPKMVERLNVTIKNYRREDVDVYEFGKNKILEKVRDVLDFEQYVECPECSVQLHKMRIKNKHLRYTLEGLRSIYSLELERFIDEVTDFHHLLGDIHDYDVWMARITVLLDDEALSRSEGEVLVELRDYCAHSRKRTYQDFVIQWHLARQNHLFEDMLEYLYCW